ncbi:MAG: chemotaxis protein CheW [Myxococcales bacterium]|nr:chemotaxis protein CheW [Myxococcales bacterium]
MSGRADELEVITFRVGAEEYALPARELCELVRATRLTRVPHAPAYVRGVINLHGEVTAVLDLATRLGLGSTELGPEARVLVVDRHGERVGLLAASVGKLTHLCRDDVRPPPPVAAGAAAASLDGVAVVEGRVLHFPNLDRILAFDGPDQATDPGPRR